MPDMKSSGQALTDALTTHFQEVFKEDKTHPIMITKAIVVCQAMCDDGNVHLYTWAGADTFGWDILGLLEYARMEVQTNFILGGVSGDDEDDED